MKKLINHPKSLLFICLFTLFAFSCKETPKEEMVEVIVESELTDTDFKSLWEKIDLLWEQRDPSFINNVYAETFERNSPGGISKSAKELKNELISVGEAFPNMKLNLIRYDIRGDMVSVHWSVDGNFTGEVAGLKGNGKPYSVTGITVLIVKDGKVVKDDSYWDTFAVFRQTGGYAIIEVESESEE